jgi:serine/threonine protein kinase
MITEIEDYILLEKINCGNMSCVWKAQHKLFNSYCAIKVVDLETNNNYNRYINECSILSRLQHNNLCSILDARIVNVKSNETLLPWKIQTKKTGLIIMPFFDGIVLKEIDRTSLTNDQIFLLFYDLVEAVDYLHSQNIVHNDISLTNIIVTKSLKSVLVDMGIARILGTKDCFCKISVAGTLDWASPEYLKSNQNKFTNDIYSIGAIIFFLLTGQKMYATNIGTQSLIRKKILYETTNLDKNENNSDIFCLIRQMVCKEKYRISNIKKIKSMLRTILVQNSFTNNLVEG